MAILIYAAEHPELPPIKVHFLNVKMSITVIATVNELLLQHLIGMSNWIFLGESLHLIRSLTVKMEDFTRNTRPFKRRASISLTYINIEFNRNSSRDSLHAKHDPTVVRAKDPRSKNSHWKMPKQNNPQRSRRHVLRRTPRSAPKSQASPLPPSLDSAPGRPI